MRHLLAALVIVAMVAVGWLPAAAVQLVEQATPATYLPGSIQIPPGFVQSPMKARILTADGVNGLHWNYVRQNPQVAPDDETRLVVGVQITDSAAHAASIVQSTAASFKSQGWTIHRRSGLIGEEAFVGRRQFDVTNPRPAESVMIFFRVGAVNGTSGWSDFADLPNYDYAMAIARIIENKMWARPWGDITAARPAAPPYDPALFGGWTPAGSTATMAVSPPPPPPPAPSAPAPSSPRAAPQGTSCPAGFLIKGNRSSSGELIYHSPGGRFYDRTQPEACFATGVAAKAAGYRASQR